MINRCMNKWTKTHFLKCKPSPPSPGASKTYFTSFQGIPCPPVILASWTPASDGTTTSPAPRRSPVLTSLICACAPCSVTHCSTTHIAIAFANQKAALWKRSLHGCPDGASGPVPGSPFLSPGIACKDSSFPSLFKYFLNPSNTGLSKWGQCLLSTCHTSSPPRRPKDMGMNAVQPVSLLFCSHWLPWPQTWACHDPISLVLNYPGSL